MKSASSARKGVIARRDERSLVIEVGGIGIRVNVPEPCLGRVGKVGERAELLTRLVVREDSLTLFGFSSEAERSMFDSLTGVSGIGPKAAISILSCGGAGDIARMIIEEDVRALVKIPGIGKKTAERIVVELKDRIEIERAPVSTEGAAGRMPAGVFEEAAEALMSLGLSRPAAERAIERIEQDGQTASLPVEDIVKMALRKVPQ